jgi:hypothetical protein
MNRRGIIPGLALIAIATTASAMMAVPASSRVGMTAAAICPSGQSQDYTCLEAHGAISADGSVDDAKATELSKTGTCPCADGSGGVTSMTVPATATDAQLDALANSQAVAAWGYGTLVVKWYTAQGVEVGSKTVTVGSKGAGFAALKATIKDLFVKRQTAVTFKFVVGKPRF